MVDVEKYFRIYGEKLAALEYGRGSFEAAFVKAVWIAYTDGLTEGRNSVPPGGLYVGLQPEINPDPSEELIEDKRKPSMSPAHAAPYGSSIEQLADELPDEDYKPVYGGTALNYGSIAPEIAGSSPLVGLQGPEQYAAFKDAQDRETPCKFKLQETYPLCAVRADKLAWPHRLFAVFDQIAERNASALVRGVSALRTSSQRLNFGPLVPMDPANPKWTDLEFTTKPPFQWSRRVSYVIAGVALGMILASAYLSRYYGA